MNKQILGIYLYTTVLYLITHSGSWGLVIIYFKVKHATRALKQCIALSYSILWSLPDEFSFREHKLINSLFTACLQMKDITIESSPALEAMIDLPALEVALPLEAHEEAQPPLVIANSCTNRCSMRPHIWSLLNRPTSVMKRCSYPTMKA